MIIAWICVLAYPAALLFGLEFENPYLELPLIVAWLAAVIFIYQDWKKGNWRA
jgi:hypothetical protein